MPNLPCLCLPTRLLWRWPGSRQLPSNYRSLGCIPDSYRWWFIVTKDQNWTSKLRCRKSNSTGERRRMSKDGFRLISSQCVPYLVSFHCFDITSLLYHFSHRNAHCLWILSNTRPFWRGNLSRSHLSQRVTVKVQNGVVSPSRMASRSLGNTRYDHFQLVYSPENLMFIRHWMGTYISSTGPSRLSRILRFVICIFLQILIVLHSFIACVWLVFSAFLVKHSNLSAFRWVAICDEYMFISPLTPHSGPFSLSGMLTSGVHSKSTAPKRLNLTRSKALPACHMLWEAVRFEVVPWAVCQERSI